MTRSRRAVGIALDVGIAALILSLIYLPEPGLVTGLVLLNDSLHHWNHFVIAPALAHQHGMALTLEVYSPYGVGWPTLMSTLSGLWPLSHPREIPGTDRGAGGASGGAGSNAPKTQFSSPSLNFELIL